MTDSIDGAPGAASAPAETTRVLAVIAAAGIPDSRPAWRRFAAGALSLLIEFVGSFGAALPVVRLVPDGVSQGVKYLVFLFVALVWLSVVMERFTENVIWRPYVRKYGDPDAPAE